MEQQQMEKKTNSEMIGTTVGIALPSQNFDVWAIAVRKQMLSALKKRGHQVES
ncbi:MULTISPECIES: hypothetical protein [unclassified Leptolyngbya]|uniref:hypothetical protein n=1 Tax=unclassified Leptolyngbya TaxID=2650499 RepID=UPI001681DE18|nr:MULTISPECIES: hypothetical protein [unclassified Leptolyngbya]MBD1913708.1 hypothetical protein [Leptolyngbya sp. FACHB-8]MBD2155174.1 hypothetical protein [Leptolyngbya sp. FACHB-16]